MVTPIVKASLHKGKKSEVKEFYSLSSYDKWMKTVSDIKKYTVKYYKGLGTSDAKEAKEYFRQLRVLTYHKDVEDDEGAAIASSQASPKMDTDRKSWILANKNPFEMEYDAKMCSFRTYLNRELIQFSMADLKRSLPHVMDGLKPSQRKVLYSCFKRKLTSEIKVS
jgi:DNA topoisomerase-2